MEKSSFWANLRPKNSPFFWTQCLKGYVSLSLFKTCSWKNLSPPKIMSSTCKAIVPERLPRWWYQNTHGCSSLCRMPHCFNVLHMECHHLKGASFNPYTHFLSSTSEPSGTPGTPSLGSRMNKGPFFLWNMSPWRNAPSTSAISSNQCFEASSWSTTARPSADSVGLCLSSTSRSGSWKPFITQRHLMS